MFSVVRLEKSTALPGGLMGVPSSRTLVKLELPPLRKMETEPPKGPVRPTAMPGENSRSSGRETAWRSLMVSREITSVGAVVCCAGVASGCAVTWTSATGAPAGSVSVPAMLALLLWDCGAALELTAGTKNAANKESIAILFFMVPPLPHARELEGWPVQRGLHGLQTSPVSWLGEKEPW